MLYQPRFALNATEDALVTLFIFIVNVMVLAMFVYYVYFAAKLEMLQYFDIDGSGDVSWSEFVLVVKQWLHADHGDTLRTWGFKVDDPSEEIAAIRQARKEKKLRAAEDNWKRGALLRARHKDISEGTPQPSGGNTPQPEYSDMSASDGDDLNSAQSRGAQGQPAAAES